MALLLVRSIKPTLPPLVHEIGRWIVGRPRQSFGSALPKLRKTSRSISTVATVASNALRDSAFAECANNAPAASATATM
jgi:hypothetical protein